MKSSPLERETDLFDAARKIAAGPRRAAFLDRACGGDSALRGRIEALLRADDEAARFFEQERAALGELAVPAEFKTGLGEGELALGTRVGHYVVLEKLGEGGWGTVYLAEQDEPFRRRVALKLIRLDLDNRSALARFEAERQALAMMDHPNIARVYDAGATPQGTPYFVLELVQGTRITEHCAVSGLELHARIELFIAVCHAIQHAHQKGVVHGDIKPSNVLITLHDGAALPKVIDFGISRSTEGPAAAEPARSAVGPLVGTPAYMSPEQAEAGSLGVDTRSDIYSLGVLLYELLTGSTPFSSEELLSGGLEEMRRRLRTDVPPPPSSLAPNLSPDLDAIVLRCLEKDRQRRYETVNGLAMDLERYLHEEPVLARGGGRLYRLGKLVRRNRAAFGAAGAILVALCAGLGASTRLFLQEREARQRAVAAEQQQNELRRQAEARSRVTQAELLINQERFDEADRLADELPLAQPSVEVAAVLRALGEWHALQRRWVPAAARFGALLRVNQLDGIDAETLDCLKQGPVVVELNDPTAFARFRSDTVTRFAGRTFPEADRILKVALLLPAAPEVLEAIRPVATATQASYRQADEAGDHFQAAWRAMSLALWAYRSGSFAEAADWAQRTLHAPEANAPRSAAARLILAMSEFRSGDARTARADLAAGRIAVEEHFHGGVGRGTPMQGFWFDWDFARILLREAGRTVDSGG